VLDLTTAGPSAAEPFLAHRIDVRLGSTVPVMSETQGAVRCCRSRPSWLIPSSTSERNC
jgi:hypothetical protein